MKQTETGMNATQHITRISAPTTGSAAADAVSVVGLGKLGACMAAAMASRGVRTVGVDVSSMPVEKIQRKLAPVFEPGLAEVIASCDGLLSTTLDIDDRSERRTRMRTWSATDCPEFCSAFHQTANSVPRPSSLMDGDCCGPLVSWTHSGIRA